MCTKLSHYHNFVRNLPIQNTCRSIEHRVAAERPAAVVIVLHSVGRMFDVVIVGGGPAGLSAALMLGRCRRRVLVCDLGQPRNRRSRALHGYMTRDGIDPTRFTELGRCELPRVRDRIPNHRRHRRGARKRPLPRRAFDGGQETARYLLIATGVIDDLPAITGLDACYGRSVFHCPYCDGWEWRDRRLAAFG